jgi:hypothetical protein
MLKLSAPSGYGAGCVQMYIWTRNSHRDKPWFRSLVRSSFELFGTRLPDPQICFLWYPCRELSSQYLL